MKRKNFFVKNYSKKQIMIDRNSFNVDIAYNLAKNVYYRNFAFKYKVAPSIREDLIQKATTRLFELSGKQSATEKFSYNYSRFWIAHNVMLSFIKTWLKQIRYKDIWRDTKEIVKSRPELAVYL